MEIETSHDVNSKLSLGKILSQNSTKIDNFNDSNFLFQNSDSKGLKMTLFSSVKKLKTKSDFESIKTFKPKTEEKPGKCLTDEIDDLENQIKKLDEEKILEKENLKLRRNVSSQKLTLALDTDSNIIRASPLPKVIRNPIKFTNLLKNTKSELGPEDTSFIFTTPIKSVKTVDKVIDSPLPRIFSQKSSGFTPVREESHLKKLNSQEISRIIFSEREENIGTSKKTVSVISFGEKESEFEIFSPVSEVSFSKDNSKSKFTSLCENPIRSIEFDLSFQNMDILRKEINKIREFGITYTDILERHEGLNYYMRAKLMDWVREAGSELGLRRETIHHSITLIDDFLLKTKNFDKSKLQLLALASMLISSKIEEIQSPSTKNFSYMSNNAFSTLEIQKMEMKVCRVLEWKLTFVSLNSLHGAMTEEWDYFLENSKFSLTREKYSIFKILREKNVTSDQEIKRVMDYFVSRVR